MRRLLVVISVLALSGAALAEPPKNVAAKPAEAHQVAAQVVLASADATHSQQGDPSAPKSGQAKRRVAPRVTTCRCGDPQPKPESQDE